jgi:uncharacterized protein
MSRQNVETVRRVYAAWNASGDGRGMFPFLSEEFEIVNPGYAIEPGTRRGLQGALTALEALEGAFADYSHEPWELIDAEDKVLALVTFRARGRQGGVEVEVYEQHVWTLKGGKVVRLEWFHDDREAREAAGLR